MDEKDDHKSSGKDVSDWAVVAVVVTLCITMIAMTWLVTR